MPSPTAAQTECLVGRSWPDLLDRREGERRAYCKPAALDTRVDFDPTQPLRDEADRRHAERRQYAARPATPSAFGVFS